MKKAEAPVKLDAFNEEVLALSAASQHMSKKSPEKRLTAKTSFLAGYKWFKNHLVEEEIIKKANTKAMEKSFTDTAERWTPEKEMKRLLSHAASELKTIKQENCQMRLRLDMFDRVQAMLNSRPDHGSLLMSKESIEGVIENFLQTYEREPLRKA